MNSLDQQVPDAELPERQRVFLERLRQHDHRVKVYRDGDKAMFHGPIIGDGPMPDSRPVSAGPEEDES